MKAPGKHWWGFSYGSTGKEPACHCRRHRNHGFKPWVGKIPLEKEMIEYFSLENPTDRGAWKAAVHGVTKESDMTEYSCIPQCPWASFIPSAFSHLGCIRVHHSSQRCILLPWACKCFVVLKVPLHLILFSEMAKETWGNQVNSLQWNWD